MASKWSIIFFFVAIAAAALYSSEAQKVHVVGGDLGWTVPPGGSIAYTTWASQQIFNHGDFLVFDYPAGFHDVAEVTKAAYDACNVQSPISSNSNGPSNVKLTTAGEHYYICTFGRHCALGMKLAINVSASTTTSPPPQPTPSSPALVSASDQAGGLISRPSQRFGSSRRICSFVTKLCSNCFGCGFACNFVVHCISNGLIDSDIEFSYNFYV